MTYEGLWSQITIKIILHFYYQIKKNIYMKIMKMEGEHEIVSVYISNEKNIIWILICYPPVHQCGFESQWGQNKNTKMSAKTTNCKTVVLNVQTFVKKKKNTAR
jgi:hypothetical protein